MPTNPKVRKEKRTILQSIPLTLDPEEPRKKFLETVVYEKVEEDEAGSLLEKLLNDDITEEEFYRLEGIRKDKAKALLSKNLEHYKEQLHQSLGVPMEDLHKASPEAIQDLVAFHGGMFYSAKEYKPVDSCIKQLHEEMDKEFQETLLRVSQKTKVWCLILLSDAHWSRCPGMFLNKRTGEEVLGPNDKQLSWSGTIQDWYGTLELMLGDTKNLIIKEGASWDCGTISEFRVSVGHDVCTILEHLESYRADTSFKEPFVYETGGLVGKLVDTNLNVYLDPEATDVIQVSAYGSVPFSNELTELCSANVVVHDLNL